jgi:hypothetical protein
VLRQSGNRSGAARVAFDREWRLARAEHDRAMAATDGTWRKANRALTADIGRAWSWLFRVTFGYGHKPARALWWVVVPILAAALISAQTYRQGQMAPNSAVILASAEWAAAMTDPRACPVVKAPDCLTPAELWLANSRAQVDWETFNPGLYALDLYVPVLDLGQAAAWAPSKDRGPWGWTLYYLRMPVQVAGWLILLVGAAVVTGLVGRREEE